MVIILVTVAVRAVLSWELSWSLLINDALYRSTPIRLDGLALGGWVAMWIRQDRTPAQLRQHGRRFLLVGGLGFVVGAIISTSMLGRDGLEPEARWMSTVGYSLLGLVGAGLIVACLEEGSPVARICSTTWLRRLGEVSYGVYLFNVIWPLRDIAQSRLQAIDMPDAMAYVTTVVVWFGLTYVMARLSYRYLESPWLALKDRLTERDHGAILPRQIGADAS